jgi:hypothetical protein
MKRITLLGAPDSETRERRILNRNGVTQYKIFFVVQVYLTIRTLSEFLLSRTKSFSWPDSPPLRGRMFKTNLQMFAYVQSRGLVPLLVLLVCLLFLFPVKVGSFQSTHGPTTTLEESMFFLLLQISLLVVGTALLSFRLLPAVGRCFGVLAWSADDRTTHDHALVSLRC